jgi:hypothetical protein
MVRSMSGVAARVGRVWVRLTPEQRMAAISAILLLLSMLLPWYQQTTLANGRTNDYSLNAFQIYGFVEAAIFVVAIGVLVLLWLRGEGRAFHLPGGDGAVIIAAGAWVMLLVFYRTLDKPDGAHEGEVVTSIGVNWGIFVAFLLGALMAWNGVRIRATHTPEPALDEDATAPVTEAHAEGPPPTEAAPTVVARRRGEDGDGTDESQLSFDEPPEFRAPR